MNEVVNAAPVTEEQTPIEAVAPVVPADVKPGEKTDSALLLESLHKEREKRRELEAELETERLRNAQPTGDVFSDEGKLLDSKINTLQAELRASRVRQDIEQLHGTYPVLKGKDAEFEQFRLDNPGMRMDTAAKAFLIENDLLDAPKPRKGLEPASGGGRTPVPTGMTAEEIDSLRVNNYNEYARRIRNGTLK